MEDGQTLCGRFRLEKLIGRGAMGEVWSARDLKLQRDVAVKRLLTEHASNKERARLFRREASVAARLQHPGIAVVHDVCEDDHGLFIVMERLSGEDLSAVVRRNPHGLGIERALGIAIRLGEAVAAAHEGNVVHRDIKPSNVMLLPHDHVKLCDFGIARLIDPRNLEPGTAGIGTPAYMAPEQFDRSGDERSDLFAYGCVLFEMLTGVRRFDGGRRRNRETVPADRSLSRPDLPDELNKLVLELLEELPQDRPSNARQAVERLEEIRQALRKAAEKPTAFHGAPRIRAAEAESSPNRQIFTLPPLRLLGSGTPARNRTAANEAVAATIRRVIEASGLDAMLGGYVRGPMTSVYEVRPAPATDQQLVVELAEQISRALGAQAVAIPSVRSSSPLPGGNGRRIRDPEQ